MLLNSTPAERVDGMMSLMGNPNTFCIQASQKRSSSTETAAADGPTFLWRMQAASGGFMGASQSITCASAECLQLTVLGVADFADLEALVDVEETTSASVALRRYQNLANHGDRCLSSSAPGPEYKLSNASAPPEGWCAPRRTGTHTQPVVLYFSRKLSDHRTCGGSIGCSAANMRALGYVEKETLCFARPADDPSSLPCRYGMPSIGRNDTAFWDQIYWRGRIWAPQVYSLLSCSLALLLLLLSCSRALVLSCSPALLLSRALALSSHIVRRSTWSTLG